MKDGIFAVLVNGIVVPCSGIDIAGKACSTLKFPLSKDIREIIPIFQKRLPNVHCRFPKIEVEVLANGKCKKAVSPRMLGWKVEIDLGEIVYATVSFSCDGWKFIKPSKIVINKKATRVVNSSEVVTACRLEGLISATIRGDIDGIEYSLKFNGDGQHISPEFPKDGLLTIPSLLN